MQKYDEKVENIIKTIASYFNMDQDLLLGNSRNSDLVEARHTLAYCLRNILKLSFPAIGVILNRDHTSIMHACKNGEEIISSNKGLQNFIDNLIKSNDKTDLVNDVSSGFNKNLNDPISLKKLISLRRENELESYRSALFKLSERKNHLIKKAQEDYKNAINEIKEQGTEALKEYKNALELFRRRDYTELTQYLNPSEILTDKELSMGEIERFLPNFKKNVLEVGLPVKFDEAYLLKIFKNLPTRSAKIIIKRYGFFNKKSCTLGELAAVEKLTGERIRQLIIQGATLIYKNNYGGLRQIINLISKKILSENIASIDQLLSEFFIFESKDKEKLKRMLLVILLSIRWIKEFDISGVKFLINISNENKIIEEIDNIKILIGKLDSTMPDLIQDRWEYISNNLILYEYFQDKKYLVSDEILRACYDNYLLESEIIVYKRETMNKYKVSPKKIEKTSGIPNEYKIFYN